MKFKDLRPVVVFLLFFLLHGTCPARETGRQYIVTGRTMGTFYTIKFLSEKKLSESLAQQKFDTRLKEVNNKLSMYNPKSEISIFNQYPENQAVKVSKDFYNVLSQAQKIFILTDGAWDGTVKPLVDLWGFGTRAKDNALPDKSAISDALARTGFSRLEIHDHTLVKKAPHITLDLGSIAKGYGVDSIAHLLKAERINDFLVEIGGELFASGKNRKGQPWSVGISRPEKNGVNQSVFKIIALQDMAIATSGNYRNYFEKNGKTYSHIINPKTGFPVKNQVVSASVIADNCTFADGLATALMVMDVQKSIDLVNTLDRVECLIIRKTGNEFQEFTSKNFSDFELR